MTGEISIHGNVKPIGGVYPKVKAAQKAGAKKVIIPKENMQSILNEIKDIEIIPVSHLSEVFQLALVHKSSNKAFTAPAIELDKKESI